MGRDALVNLWLNAVKVMIVSVCLLRALANASARGKSHPWQMFFRLQQASSMSQSTIPEMQQKVAAYAY